MPPAPSAASDRSGPPAAFTQQGASRRQAAPTPAPPAARPAQSPAPAESPASSARTANPEPATSPGPPATGSTRPGPPAARPAPSASPAHPARQAPPSQRPAPSGTPAPPQAPASPAPAASPAQGPAPVPPAASSAPPTTRPAPPAPPATGPDPVTHTPPPVTRRRPVGAVDLTSAPGAVPPPPGGYRTPVRHGFPETPVETTTRLRPVRPRQRWRTAAAAACVVLGLGLIGGAATGAWLTGDSSAGTARSPYTAARAAWHSVPVDTLFPRTLKGRGAGPGGTHRTWTRVAVAADSTCKDGLDPLLLTTLRSVGCERLVRATYTDATRSAVTTVGLVFTEADASGMQALRTRFTEQKLGARKDLMPRTYAPEGTSAASFGDKQRASWTVNPLTEIPVVVLAVSGFADGRAVAEPQPASDAMASGAETDIAQAGLGHEAKGVADRVERGLRTAVADLTEQPG